MKRSALLRKTELRAKARKPDDKVTPELYGYIVARDGYGCVAPSLGATDKCAGRWGQPIQIGHFTSDDITLDHVRDQPMIGKRAPSDARHLVALCWHHHLNGWATANRAILRVYINMAESGFGTKLPESVW